LNIRKPLKKILGEDLYWSLKFYFNLKKWPDINNPQYFNEKVRWRMKYDQNFLYVKCADKVKVREYIKNKIGEKYLIPVRYYIENVADITSDMDFKNSVIKANHGAGMVMFVDEKQNINDIKQTLNQWMTYDYTEESNERHYAKIAKKILVEESLCVNGKPPIDYKLHTFQQLNGDFKFVLQLVNGRFTKESRGYYLEDLDECIWSHGDGHHELDPEIKPKLREAMQLSKKICEDFNYVRADWYIVDNNIYFGELTFTPGAAASYEFGSKLEKIMASYWQV